MKHLVKSILIYSAVFVGGIAVMLGFLVMSAKVGRETVQDKFEESAEFLCEDIVFPYKEEGIKPSCIDRYADSILLNVAYFFDTEKPLESVMWASYYFTMFQNENNNLYDAVYEGQEKNKQYLRYWHGSAAVIRLLHTFLNIKQIYVFHACVLIILFGILAFILIRNKLLVPAAAVGLSLIAVSVWYVPFSLEYTWAFICMFAASIAAVLLTLKKKEAYLGVMFLVTGMVTNYLDFLTTETLSLTVPLILVLSIKYRSNLKAFAGQGRPAGRQQDADKGSENSLKGNLLFLVKNAVSWGIGYIGMWVSKWLIASIVLGENVMPYINEHIEERLSGEIGVTSFMEYLWMAVYRNFACLFPMDYGAGGVITAGVLLLAILYVCFVYKKKKIEWNFIILLLILGIVPVVRFMILRNHSALHHFFTFRALMATVLAFMLSAWSTVSFKTRPDKKKR